MYIILIVIISAIYCFYALKFDYWKRKGVKGPKTYPFLGTLYEDLFTASNVLQEQRYQKYGRIYGTMQFLRPVITIGDPELIKSIKITDFSNFMNRRSFFENVPFFSKVLTELKDKEWKRMRSLLSPVFSSGKLKAMIPLINQSVSNTLEYCEQLAIEEKEVNLKNVMLSYTMDTIAICAFAMKTNTYKDPENEFVRKGLQITDIKIWRLILNKLPKSIRNILGVEILPENLKNYFTVLLKSVIDDRKAINLDINDFVKLLLDAELKKENEDSITSTKLKLTEEEIIGNCIMFFLAGFETTSTLLQYTLYSLALNPEVQEKLFDEIRNYLDENKIIDYNSFIHLPYLDAVINESLRLYTPVITFEQVCGKDYKLGNTGITIDKGTIVTIPYYSMHRDPDNFPNPYEFKPDRFLPGNRQKIKPYTFLPFGTGPRICIGMRFSSLTAKLFIAYFVNKFKIQKSKNTPTKPEFNGSFFNLNCKPLKATFKRRN